MQLNSTAQQFKGLRMQFGFQGNIPERFFNSSIPKFNDKNGGFGIHLQPKWFFKSKHAIGVNLEYALVVEDYQSDAIGAFNIVSFCPTYSYYFSNKKVRPFVGFGAGAYSVIYFNPAINIGIKPLIGINLFNYVEVALEYNRILNHIHIDPKVMGTFDNYYIGAKASVSLGILKR